MCHPLEELLKISCDPDAVDHVSQRVQHEEKRLKVTILDLQIPLIPDGSGHNGENVSSSRPCGKFACAYADK